MAGAEGLVPALRALDGALSGDWEMVEDTDSTAKRRKAAERAARSQRVRWLAAKKKDLTGKGDVFGRVHDGAAYDRMCTVVLAEETDRELVIMELENSPQTVPEIANGTKLPLARTMMLVTALMRQGRVDECGVKGAHALFGLRKKIEEEPG